MITGCIYTPLKSIRGIIFVSYTLSRSQRVCGPGLLELFIVFQHYNVLKIDLLINMFELCEQF
jgi:hypothetical protein